MIAFLGLIRGRGGRCDYKKVWVKERVRISFKVQVGMFGRRVRVDNENGREGRTHSIYPVTVHSGSECISKVKLLLSMLLIIF